MAKSYLSNGAIIAAGTSSSNYVQQIAAGQDTFDIAVKNGIRFFVGQDDENGVLWDGVTPLEVVIPAISDLVQDPVRLVGTVGAEGTLPASPVKGDLVYITADCTIDVDGVGGSDPGIACEAGDMALYDGHVWHVIQGENQVKIIGAPVNNVVTVALSGTAKSVLDVEGTSLALGIDYSDVRSKISLSKNASNTISVTDGSVTVSPMYIGLTQGESTSVDITTSVSIDLPTALADGAVTIDSVLQASDFSFDAGSLPSISLNADAISLNVSHNISLAKSENNGDFVTDVTAINGISFIQGTSSANDLAYVTGLSSIAGTSFVSGIHTYDSTIDEGKTADLTVWGQATVSNSTFISGLSEASTSGDLVSAITVGTVSLDATGSGILTGLSTEGSDVVTNVSFGSLAQDATAQWFFSGLTTGSDVVTGITVGEVSLVTDNNSSFASNAITSASVSNHVLTFTTGSFMTPVSVSQASSTVSMSGFSKSGVKVENASVSKAGFTTASLSQAATSVSFKSLLSGDVTLSQSSVSYFFDKAQDHNYEVVKDYVSISTTAATVTKNAIALENPTITAAIPAGSVAVSLTGGAVASFSVGNPTGTISGSVSTALSTEEVSWLAVDDSKKTITTAGAYSFGVVASDASGAVTVAAPSTYDLDDAEVTIAADTYVEDVLVDGVSVLGE